MVSELEKKTNIKDLLPSSKHKSKFSQDLFIYTINIQNNQDKRKFHPWLSRYSQACDFQKLQNIF